MTLKKRFILLTCFLAVIVVLESSILFSGNFTIIKHASNIHEHEIPTLNKSHELKLAVVQVQQWLTDISATRGQDGLNDGFDEAENNAQLFRTLINELVQIDSGNTKRYQAMLPVFEAYFETGKRMAKAYIDEGPSGGNKMMAEFDEVASKMSKEVDSLLKDTKLRTESFLTTQEEVSVTNEISLVVGSLALLMGISILYILMVRAIADLPRIAEQVASGDLSTSIDVNRKDEVGQIMSALNSVMLRLRDMVSQITGVVHQLSATANDMTTLSSTTRDNILELHTQAEQSATAINEMAATTQEVTSNVTQAAKSAQEANNETAEGQKTVDKTISQIKGLAEKIDSATGNIHDLENDTQNISTVLDVIKGIAEQTNLLALNAAIEAARAGEQGRGFAVVADEVRTLASRTQESTNEINQMIEKLQSGARNAVDVMNSSREEAYSVVEQASTAGTTLTTIASAVSRIDDMTSQIANAMSEQSAVADEANSNIVRISDLAGSATDGAEHTATTSNNLLKIANDLEELISHYKM